MRKPAERVAVEFTATFGGSPDGIWWAPGRVNLIGEHTDYQDGFVLPLALATGVAAAARVVAAPVLRARSLQGGDLVELPLDEIGPGKVDGWMAYVGGVAWALREAGHSVPGMEVVLDGDVPVGAGLSSSAALECSVATAWNDLAGLKLSRSELAAAARRAENEVAGAPTGWMDQMASLYGLAGHLVFLDTRSLTVEHVPFDPAAVGLTLLVIDSKAPHALVDGEYAERFNSCAEAAKALGVGTLRDITAEELPAALARLDDELLRKRVRHVVTENGRVLEVVAALKAGADPREIGPILTASHDSMRDDFEITVPEIDTAVRAALDAGAYGARMTGGGFGGCVLALTDTERVPTLEEAVRAAYAAAGYRPPVTFTVTAADGAHQIT